MTYDAKTAEEWLSLSEARMAAAKMTAEDPGTFGDSARSSTHAVELCLKGVLSAIEANFEPRRYGHDLEKMLDVIVQSYPQMEQVRGAVQLVSNVSWESPTGAQGACQSSRVALYNPQVCPDDADARVQAAGEVGQMAREILGVPA